MSGSIISVTKSGETRDRIFDYIKKRILEHDPPTVRDVQKAFGFKAVQSANEHIQRLVAEGKLQKRPHKARNLRLPKMDLLEANDNDCI